MTEWCFFMLFLMGWHPPWVGYVYWFTHKLQLGWNSSDISPSVVEEEFEAVHPLNPCLLTTSPALKLSLGSFFYSARTQTLFATTLSSLHSTFLLFTSCQWLLLLNQEEGRRGMEKNYGPIRCIHFNQEVLSCSISVSCKGDSWTQTAPFTTSRS